MTKFIERVDDADHSGVIQVWETDEGLELMVDEDTRDLLAAAASITLTPVVVKKLRLLLARYERAVAAASPGGSDDE